MTRPEEALQRARDEVARRRQDGDYDDDLAGFRIEPMAEINIDKLLEWALIEPDIERVYSTRRLGRPITAFKRGLIWAQRQYHGQVYGQQTRFNHHVVVHASKLAERVRVLNERVRELEEEVGRLDRGLARARGEGLVAGDDRPPTP